MLLLCSESARAAVTRDPELSRSAVIKMLDGGRNDEKIIAIPFNDPTYNRIHRRSPSFPSHIFDEMRHFFTVYKALEHKETAVDEVNGREDAVAIIQAAIDSYVEVFCK